MLVAEDEERVGESCALLWGVDLLGDDREFVPAVVWLVISDRVAQALQLGRDQLRERDVEGEVDRGNVEEVLPEHVECLVREAGECVGGVVGECSEVSSGHLLLRGSALLAAAAFGLAA